MTKRQTATPAPDPLEEYAQHFDGLFGKRNQREGFRRYLEGLLRPRERHKTLTGLANTEPDVGAQQPRAQSLQWFLSEADWDEREVQQCRLRLLEEDPSTAPTTQGVLVIDEHGDRKDGHKTAHVGRQYLSNLGKINNGVVSVTSLWADERIYYPLDFEPYTPAHHFTDGKADPRFRTKLKLGVALVRRSVQAHLPFRAVVADSFYGEGRGFKQVKHALGWSQYQVRSDSAIRRHWQLVCCAFSFCWYHQSHSEAAQAEPALQPDGQPKAGKEPISDHFSAVGGKNQHRTSGAAKRVLAQSPQSREGLAGALGLAPQILAGVVGTAPTAPAPTTF